MWQGVDIVLSRPVAVRLAGPRSSATSRFAHPGVVTLFDGGADGGQPFTVLELVAGEDLGRVLGRGPLELETAVSMGIQVGRALSAGHAAGCAHGALGDDAVLLLPSGRVKLTPFRVGDAAPSDMAADVRATAALVLRAAGPRPPAELQAVLTDPTALGSAEALVEGLGGLGIVDDAVDLADLAPTPPGGQLLTTSRSRPSAVPGLVVLGLVAVAAAVAFAIARAPADPRTPNRPGRAGGPVVVASASSFDPLGDGGEHDEEAALAIDGDPSTSWTTSRYATRALGGLKPGVGLVLRLDEPARLTALEVRTVSTGWKAQIYVADAPGRDLAGWGTPVATTDGGSSAQVFRLDGASVGAVLIWVTDLGDAPPPLRFSVGEAILTR